MKLSTLIFVIICFFGTLYHILFFPLNDVLKVADSFAYLQMSHFLKDFSLEGFGNGWFGFLYSVPIALLDYFLGNDFLAAKIINLVFFNISAVLLWKISRILLSPLQSCAVIALFFVSPILLHFNIHVLSENMYIPLFLLCFLLSHNLIRDIYREADTPSHSKKQIQQAISIACVIGCMYLTRAEAFIYLGSIGILAIGVLVMRQISFYRFLSLGSVFLISFIIFISPYLIFLHGLTGDWGLTNKGASNLRQAELRGRDKMDDAGFEQAVGELTADKQHLIAGFAGGMPYDRPSIEGNLGEFVTRDPQGFITRFGQNQVKLYTHNIPEIFLGKSPSLFLSGDLRFGNNYVFLVWSIIPLLVLIYGLVILQRKEKIFFYTTLSFFIPAAVFFTLFFTLNRYFLIFVPLFFIVFLYGLSQIPKWNKTLGILLFLNFLGVLLLSTSVYYNEEKSKDAYYELKKEAGLWLGGNTQNSQYLTIMERFPIVTYYSGSKFRYITPYTDTVEDIRTYAKYTHIDYLVVDTMDFATYRPELKDLLIKTPEGFINLQEFKNELGQKVIVYKIQ